MNELVLKNWNDIPDDLKNKKVKEYYDILYNKRTSLVLKRIFDLVLSIIMLIFLSPIFLILGLLIKLDSDGPIMFRQERITQYGRRFKIYKFRTMINNAEKVGTQVTRNNDTRITKIGNILRKYRLDEIPQLINILIGDMSFVGTRPEVGKYVEKYNDEMKATLLLPAGVTSEASIEYKDEARLLTNSEDVEKTYINYILPDKMKYNLKSIKNFSFLRDIKTMIKTIVAVFK